MFARSLARSLARATRALRHKFSALISFHGESVDKNSSDCQLMRSRLGAATPYSAAARVARGAHALRRIYPWNARLCISEGANHPPRNRPVYEYPVGGGAARRGAARCGAVRRSCIKADDSLFWENPASATRRPLFCH